MKKKSLKKRVKKLEKLVDLLMHLEGLHHIPPDPDPNPYITVDKP